MVEFLVVAADGLDVGPGHLDQARVLVVGLEAADAPVGDAGSGTACGRARGCTRGRSRRGEAQAREDLAGDARPDLVVLVVVDLAAGVFGRVQLAHVVEQAGQHAVPVVGQLLDSGA